MDNQYLQQLGDWLVHVELCIGDPQEPADQDEALRELREAIGTAQVAVARMLAERRLLA